MRTVPRVCCWLLKGQLLVSLVVGFPWGTAPRAFGAATAERCPGPCSTGDNVCIGDDYCRCPEGEAGNKLDDRYELPVDGGCSESCNLGAGPEPIESVEQACAASLSTALQTAAENDIFKCPPGCLVGGYYESSTVTATCCQMKSCLTCTDPHGQENRFELEQLELEH